MEMAQRTQTVKVSASGRIVIPAAFRKELGLRTGDDLLIQFEDGCLHLRTRAQGLKRAQEIVGKYLGRGGPSMADELIAERHAEAAREDEEFERWRSGQSGIE